MTDESAGDDQMRGALLPGRVGLFVRLSANPGGRTGLLDALHRYADRLASEPNTEAFVIALDPDDEDVVWLYEWFTDEGRTRSPPPQRTIHRTRHRDSRVVGSTAGAPTHRSTAVASATAMLDDTVV